MPSRESKSASMSIPVSPDRCPYILKKMFLPDKTLISEGILYHSLTFWFVTILLLSDLLVMYYFYILKVLNICILFFSHNFLKCLVLILSLNEFVHHQSQLLIYICILFGETSGVFVVLSLEKYEAEEEGFNKRELVFVFKFSSVFFGTDLEVIWNKTHHNSLQFRICLSVCWASHWI